MLKNAKSRAFVLLGIVVLLGGTYVAAAASTGHYFHHDDFHHDGDGSSHEITRTISITPYGGTGSSSMDLTFTRLLPGTGQTVTLDYRNTGTSNEDVYIVFPNETALSALNTLGNYGAVHLSSSGTGSIGDVFDSTNLSDKSSACGTFSPSGCWPLLKQYEVARNIGPKVSGSFSFGFTFASAFNKQAAPGATAYWNSYPVSGQTTVLASDGSGSGLPYEIVATQPGITPGQTGKITQVDPFERTVSAANSGSSFSDQLEVNGSSGAVTYVVTSPNSHLKVTPSGAISTVGQLTPGNYTVAGTDADTSGDTGTWTYTLTVTPSGTTTLELHPHDPSSVNVGSNVTYSASVQGSTNTPHLSGTVTFYANGVAIHGCENESLANNESHCTTNFLSAGSITLSATYANDPNFSGSSDSVTQVVKSNLSITTKSLPDLNDGNRNYVQQLSGTGGTAPYTWSVVSGNLPAGLNLNSKSGVISGETHDSSQSETFTVQLTDSSGSSTTQVLSIDVRRRPSFTWSGSDDAREGHAFHFWVTTSDTSQDRFSESGRLPQGVDFDASTGEFSGTPAHGSHGSYDITFTASNEWGSTTNNFTLNVSS